MTLKPRLTIAYASLFAALALAVPGRAEPPVPAPPTTEVDAARAKFAAGADAYRAGRYQEAIEAFLAADAIAPRAALSFNVARAYDKLGDAPRALEYYRQYLERDPNGATAVETRTRIAELEAEANAADTASPPTPPEPPPLAATTPSPRAAAEPPRSAPPSESPLRPVVRERSQGHELGAWPWVALGAGGALLVTSLGFELARRGTEDDVESASHAEFEERYAAMERRKVTARVFAGVGGALLIAGGVLVYLDHENARDDLALACGPGTCGARWEHRF